MTREICGDSRLAILRHSGQSFHRANGRPGNETIEKEILLWAFSSHTRSQRVEKRKIVTEWNSSPGFKTVEGKAGWFGESG